MQQFRRILVGVDLSSAGMMSAAALAPSTREAVRRAIWLAEALSSELTFFAAEDVATLEEDLLHERFRLDSPGVEERAHKVLDELRAEAQSSGVQAEAKFVFGQPWEAIIKEVLRNKHQVVVIGTRNRGTVARMLFGSTGLKLLRCCPVPVWVTRPDLNWDDLNILVASDLSEVSQRGLDLAVSAAQLAGGKVHLLHAIEDSIGRRMWLTGLPEDQFESFRDSRREQAEQRLHEQLAQTDYRTLSNGVQVHVVEGSADVAILEAIETCHIDLLVMGTAARRGIGGLLIGNTAERLLAQVPCSVLVVKPDDFQCPVQLSD